MKNERKEEKVVCQITGDSSDIRPQNDGVLHSSPLAAEFAYGWSEANPDSEQIEPIGAELHRRNSASVEQIKEGEDVAKRQVRGQIDGVPEFTNPSPLIPLPQGEREKRAFTLAEVLITLGIIGIVAAMTMPTLIQKHNKRVVETRLMKFYSTINQAIRLAEVEYGDKKYWYQDAGGLEVDENGDPIEGSSVILNWYNKYLAKHIKLAKIELDEGGNPVFYLVDGGAFECVNNHDRMRDWIFYTSNPKKCRDNTTSVLSVEGKCAFRFLYAPTKVDGDRYIFHYDKGFEPYKFDWNGNLTYLKNACYTKSSIAGGVGNGNGNAYCTAFIQLNGWKIPDDYPYKVWY